VKIHDDAEVWNNLKVALCCSRVLMVFQTVLILWDEGWGENGMICSCLLHSFSSTCHYDWPTSSWYECFKQKLVLWRCIRRIGTKANASHHKEGRAWVGSPWLDGVLTSLWMGNKLNWHLLLTPILWMLNSSYSRCYFLLADGTINHHRAGWQVPKKSAIK